MMTMIYHCTPSNKDTPFNKDTYCNKFKENFEVLGPSREGDGGIAEKGEGDQRKQGGAWNKDSKKKKYIFGFLGLSSCCSVSH